MGWFTLGFTSKLTLGPWQSSSDRGWIGWICLHSKTLIFRVQLWIWWIGFTTFETTKQIIFFIGIIERIDGCPMEKSPVSNGEIRLCYYHSRIFPTASKLVRGKPNRNTESWGKYVAPIRKYHGKPSSCHQKKNTTNILPSGKHTKSYWKLMIYSGFTH